MEKKKPLPPVSTKTEVCRRLVAARLALGLNAATFAGNVGIKPTAWANYESLSRMPNVADMIRISFRYGLPLDYIYAGRMDRVPNELVSKIEDFLAGPVDKVSELSPPDEFNLRRDERSIAEGGVRRKRAGT